MIVAEQKARTTYDNILRLVDDPAVKDLLSFYEKEKSYTSKDLAKVVGWGLAPTEHKLDCKNFYAFNPVFDVKK